MTTLSLILNDPEPPQGFPSHRQLVHSPFQEPLAYWSDNQDFLLPSAAFSGQQTYNRSFVLLPFSSNASQSACNLFLDTRSSHCGPGGLPGPANNGGEVDLMTGWPYSGSLLVPSLLDPASVPTCDEPSQDSVSSKTDFERELHASPLLKLLIHWYSPRDHLALRPHRFQPQRRNPSATPESSSRTTRSSVLRTRSCQPTNVKLVKRPACHSCKVKKIRCFSDPNLGDSDSTPCMPCRKNGNVCDYSRPLEGSRAFDVALRQRQIRDDERKRRPPKAPRAKKPRKKCGGVRRFVTPVSAEDFAKILEASTV
ncbi:hypothetical protein BKA70DRAFT_1437434 [Coprinopsis sp. MPI-PUGE-AT-0042]|nr:hypothetical protein BKA70DRAFT_1437434 [Coprinopsis sp. MPI-PUGE-AT-0042]